VRPLSQVHLLLGWTQVTTPTGPLSQSAREWLEPLGPPLAPTSGWQHQQSATIQLREQLPPITPSPRLHSRQSTTNPQAVTAAQPLQQHRPLYPHYPQCSPAGESPLSKTCNMLPVMFVDRPTHQWKRGQSFTLPRECSPTAPLSRLPGQGLSRRIPKHLQLYPWSAPPLPRRPPGMCQDAPCRRRQQAAVESLLSAELLGGSNKCDCGFLLTLDGKWSQ
jgi:hypothetical protein